jgi:hypothetical protein
VRLVEPAFPASRGGEGPIASGQPGAEAARYLHERRLLPPAWSADAHDGAVWRAMLERFAAAYALTLPPPALARAPGDRDGMLDDAARTLAAVSLSLRPLAVLAIGARDVVTFFAVVWNWTPSPRLIIVRTPDDLVLGPGRGPEERAAGVLAAMGTCALRFRAFVYAPEHVALRVFVAQGRSTMRVLASEPPRPGWPLPIPAERVLAAIRFDDPELEGLDVIAVAIEGPSLSVRTALTVMAYARTNLALDGFFYHLALP